MHYYHRSGSQVIISVLLTPSRLCGEPVLIHNIGLTDPTSGKLSVLRLDLQPLTKDVEKKERCSTSAGECSDEVCLQDALKQVDTRTAHSQQEDIL